MHRDCRRVARAARGCCCVDGSTDRSRAGFRNDRPAAGAGRRQRRAGFRRAGSLGHFHLALHVGYDRAVQGGREPWGLTYQMWSWVPEDTLAPGEALFLALPLFHNSGRSGFNYVLSRGGCLVTRDKFSATSVWDDVRKHDCVALALVGPLTALLYGAPPKDDDADNPGAQRDPRADDSADRGIQAAVRRAGVPFVTARPRSVRRSRPPWSMARGRTVAGGGRAGRGTKCASSTSTTSPYPSARSAR